MPSLRNGGVALDTGASRGLGRAALMASGDVRASVLPALVIADALGRFGRLDILVNNPGALSAGAIEAVEEGSWQEMLAVHLSAAHPVCRAAFDPMCRQGWGRVINIASITAQTGGVSGSVACSAAKGGLLAMTHRLSRDGARHGIGANAVAPGQIDTGMGRAMAPEALRAVTASIPLGRMGTPEEIGDAVLFLASEGAGFITGATLDVTGGILKR